MKTEKELRRHMKKFDRWNRLYDFTGRIFWVLNEKCKNARTIAKKRIYTSLMNLSLKCSKATFNHLEKEHKKFWGGSAE